MLGELDDSSIVVQMSYKLIFIWSQRSPIHKFFIIKKYSNIIKTNCFQCPNNNGTKQTQTAVPLNAIQEL